MRSRLAARSDAAQRHCADTAPTLQDSRSAPCRLAPLCQIFDPAVKEQERLPSGQCPTRARLTIGPMDDSVVLRTEYGLFVCTARRTRTRQCSAE
jgi:hypothetical protein